MPDGRELPCQAAGGGASRDITPPLRRCLRLGHWVLGGCGNRHSEWRGSWKIGDDVEIDEATGIAFGIKVTLSLGNMSEKGVRSDWNCKEGEEE